MVGRWLVGFFKRIFNIWDDREWAYYTQTALDPKLPAFSRWDLNLHSTDKPPQGPEDELLPKKQHTIILHDKTGLTPEDIVYFHTDLGRVQILEKKLQEELRSRNAGWFWFDQIRNRNLDFIHNLRMAETLPMEGSAEEQDLDAMRREFFRN
jgi:hypothetical protein